MNTRNIYKVIVAALLSTASMCLAIEGTWTRKSDMPTARSGLCASVVDGKIYAMGGGPSTGVVTTTVEQYDPATDTWTRKANMRIPRGFFGASTVNGKIYVVGGYGSGGIDLASVEEYDPVLDTWTIKSSMPTARDQVATVAIAGKIYAVGGLSSDVSVRALEEYDPALDTWTRRSDMPTARLQVSCSTVEGILFAIGGASGMGGSALSAVEAYDPTTDTWTSKVPMPTARVCLSTCVVDGKIFAIGGCVNPYDSSELSSVEVYDPATDTWTKMPDMQVKRKALASAAVNGKIYAIGGQAVAGWDAPLSTVEEYDPNPIVVDLNADDVVDFTDFSMLAQYWHQGQSPLTNHRLDFKYLAGFSEYWLADFRLTAHWKLDEAEGAIACDSVGTWDGVVNGGAIWRPAGGRRGGALEFDGVDDYISTDFVLDPAAGSFSVFVWVKDCAPGKAIISQANHRSGRTVILGSTWLGTDASGGKLVTTLMGGTYGALESDVTITDGQWHHVGLVYDLDGLCRRLYVDGLEVARDADPVGGVSSSGHLYFGAGQAPETGSFFWGLIDDVRIYNRAVTP